MRITFDINTQADFEKLRAFFATAQWTGEERREEERAIRELEAERLRAEREELHYQAALEKVKQEIESATGVKYDRLV